MALCALVLGASWPSCPWPARRERLVALGTTALLLLGVPGLKHFSSTSCPWDLTEFGGSHPFVSHWRAGLADGGPGHCFPSGHAVAAFAFLSVYFLWRRQRPHAARPVLVVVMALGLAFGWAQLARGAHFVSHTLWSAWLCWTACMVADHVAWPRPASDVGMRDALAGAPQAAPVWVRPAAPLEEGMPLPTDVR